MGFIKKIPGVGFLLDKMRSKTEDEKIKEEIAELEDDLAGAYFFKSGRVKDEKRLAELREKLRMDAAESQQLVPTGQEGVGLKQPLKTANLAGVKPSGVNFKDVDPSEMTREQLRAALIDYNREKDKYKGGRRKMFDRRNTKLRQALSRRRLEFKREDRDIAEEENQASYVMTQSALDKIVVGGGGSTTVVNNTNNSPVNNNTKTTTLSPLVQVDPVMKQAISSAL